MAESQAEPFHIALVTLRDRLQTGKYPPGVRITAVDVADELRLSNTPVREALSRLAGEGLVEDRRGQGYFVRQPSASDVADLYRLSLAHLLISQELHRAGRKLAAHGGDSADGEAGRDPIRRVEELFRGWIIEAGSGVLITSFRLLQIQLGPVRRLEPGVLEDLDGEAERLTAVQEPSADRLALVRQFHGRRIRVAHRLAALLEAAARPGK
jgi:DNA-binding transcriptional regulator YhcF (GntR family)